MFTALANGGAAPPGGGVGREHPINHPKRSDSLVRKRIIDECQRTEPGINGLARTNLRFSSQGGSVNAAGAQVAPATKGDIHGPRASVLERLPQAFARLVPHCRLHRDIIDRASLVSSD